jgi:hypothetical protein
MSEFNTVLNASFSDIIKRYNKFQLSNHTKASIDEGNIILHDGIKLLNQLKSFTRSLETALSDCQDFINDVVDDLSQTPKKEDFVFHTKNGMLSYLGRDFIVKKPDNANKNKPPAMPIQLIQVERVLLNEVGYYMKLPCITDIKRIPPMFYYFKGNDEQKYLPGVYCCLIPNVFIKVPFPEIVDSTKEYSRDHSIKCKYKTRNLCDDQRSKMARLHNSQVRVCNFAHEGEELVKIGYPARCSTIPNFGNPSTLTHDIKIIELSDIKNILLYGMSDIITSAIWLDYVKTNTITVFDKLEFA